MTATFTVYRAGNYYIQTKVNNVHVIGSDFYQIDIIPDLIYGFNCVAINVPDKLQAGWDYSFEVQARDLYKNNI